MQRREGRTEWNGGEGEAGRAGRGWALATHTCVVELCSFLCVCWTPMREGQMLTAS